MDRETIAAFGKQIIEDGENLHKRYLDIMNFLDVRGEAEIQHLRDLKEQMLSDTSGSLLPKTPKVQRKKVLQKIKTIPEDEVINNSIKSVVDNDEEESEEEEEIQPTRSKRAASQRATESIKKQQSLTLVTKLRRPSVEEEAVKNQTIRISSTKRPKTSVSGSDDDDRPSKIQKTGKLDAKKRGRKKIKDEPVSSPEKIDPPKVATPPPEQPPRKTRSSSLKSAPQPPKPQTPPPKPPTPPPPSNPPNPPNLQIIDETMDIRESDMTITEPSMYEDAIAKLPMNSTMNPNTTMTIDRKMMNATVVIEKINETITIKKASTSSQNSRKNSLRNLPIISPLKPLPSAAQSKQRLQNKLTELKESLANQEFDGLLTDDESSPERKVTLKKPSKPLEKFKRLQKPVSSSEDSETEPATPQKPVKEPRTKPLRDLKYKTNTIFSPYAKESVKKKVEAFEQAVQGSPKDCDLPTRVTRTKTRAMAAAAETPNVAVQTIAQKLARKSLAKAKKISLCREKRENDEGKENLLTSASKPGRLLANDGKLLMKQAQRTTPVSKSRLQMPMSVNRIHHTPASQLPPAPTKAMTASKAHLAASTESLLSNKPLSKSGSTDSLADKKRLLNEEDARKKKREEALKAATEEKKRKREEKELKNRLAREAKERLEMERRLKLEKEREDKARQAIIAQEKMREEAERKKLAQLQRAQEKEEKRRQEEAARLRKIQEQEEAEKRLAEQKRREQEAERKRLIEARNQQLAAVESDKLKTQLMAKAKQMAMLKAQGPQTYAIDSDCDDDDTDDESRPKHAVPYWAKPEVRKAQLDMQQYINMDLVLKFFGAKKCTPDLADLFVGIKKDRLKRTSSANWKTPPRFSMMED